VKERKRDKKKRLKQLGIIMEVVRVKAKEVKGQVVEDQVMDYCKYHLVYLTGVIDLGLTKGIDDDQESRGRIFDVDSDENSCGDDSDFSDKVGIERRLIKP